jgi:hypothetical protein
MTMFSAMVTAATAGALNIKVRIASEISRQPARRGSGVTISSE